jgi:hypothetical protein
VAEDNLLAAAGLFPGVGQDGEELRVEGAGREEALVVGGQGP